MLDTRGYAIFIPNEMHSAMTTIVINENSDEGRMLMHMIRAAQQSSDAVVSIRDDDAAGRIPGLAYTKEERLASVRCAEEDYAAGRFVTSEELKAKYPRV